MTTLLVILGLVMGWFALMLILTEEDEEDRERFRQVIARSDEVLRQSREYRARRGY